ncbi:cadherin-like domain-containing protein [Leptolyngbya sp. FACHB-36]|uniref:cadherin-like domain-containing protein n=1 Tax=Leptolyngbya sp. FACHB-36 TaxID=2692808 RepID=UPI001A7E4AD9|nr:cadherin-like domain-containing protein [Leptolyngbya sp. FACHB-36]
MNDSPSRIAYRHNGSETLQDSFQFTVSDSAGGAISTRTFDIKVNPVNDPPRLISLGALSVTESDTAITPIGKSLLQAIDPDPNTQITYTVLSAPTGTLLLDSTPVTTFTQADIDAGRLKYRQGGSEAASDSFSFSITDGATELIGPSVFNISITPSNDAPQIVLNDRLTLNESGTQSITNGLLLVTDVDGPGPVTYTLNGAPTKGQLKLGDQALSSNQTFTQDDITDNRISYTHDGSESTADSFSFRASDGSTGTLPLTTFNIRVNSVNDAPIVTVPGAQTIDEDTSLTFGTGRLISITDVDAGDSPLFVELRVNNGKLTVNTPSTIVTGNGTNTVILQGAQGRISTILNGGIKYDPDKDFNGLDVLTVRADDQGSSGDDGQQQFTLKTIDIAVRAINDSPTLRLMSSTTTVREDEVLNLAFLTTDVDAGDSFVKATLVATNGTLTVASSNIGFLDGTSNGGRTVTFTGTIADITNALSSVDYQGVRNYNGTDTISVTIDDQGSTGANGRPTLLTIPVTVTAVNDAPSFTAGTSQTVNERDDSGVIRVASWATAISRGGGADEAAQTLAFDVTTDSNNLFTSNGRPVINASTGELSYTLAPNAFGTANVTVVLRDSGSGTAPNVNLSAPSIFTIGANPVNDAPTFTRRASTATIDEDAPAQTVWWATGISAGPATPTPNGVPNEATTQTVEFVIDNSNPNLFESGPTIAPNGTLTYKTAQDANGTAILTVRLRDDGGTENGGVNVSGPQTYTINVRSVNDAPLLAIPTTLDTEEDTSLDITGLSITDVDAGDGPLRVTLTALGMGTSGTSGTLGVAATQGVTILTGSNGSNLQLTGKLNDLNTALSSLKYQGKLNVSGTDRISVSVTDNGNTGTIGGTKTATGTFSVNVAAVNDAPTVTISTANRPVQEDLSALLPGLSVTDVDAGSTGVVEVTVSALQGTLTLPTAGLTISANGTNSVTARGVLSILNSALANLRYTSNLNYNGPDEITVTIDDQALSGIGGAQRDSKSFSLNITPVNDLPQLTMPAGPLSVNEDEALTFTGAAAIALTDVDSGSNPIQVTLAVNSGSLALTDTGLRLITGTSNPSGGQRSLTYEGTIDSIRTALETLIYRGNPNAFGSDNLTVTVNDRGKTGATSGTDVTRSVSITVASVNDVPVLVTNRSLSLLEGTTKLISSGLLNTTDADSPPQSSLVYMIDTAPTTTNSRLILRNGTTVTTLGAGSTFTQADITGNRLSYMHGGGEDSSDSFVFRVSDGSGGTIDSTTFNISVTPSNDTPLVTTNASLTVMEGDTLNILPAFLQATDADNRPSELRYTLTSALSSGTLLLNGGSLSVNQTFTQEDIDFGRLAYSHSGSETTRDSFSFALSDGSSGSNGTFNIAVTPVNDPVTLASNNPLTVNEGATTNITKGLLQAIDPDTPLSEIRYTLTAAPLRGTLRLNNNSLAAGGTFTEQDIQSGLLSYQHLGGEQTDDTFFFRVSSTGNDLQLDDRFVIRVNPLNDAPVLVRNTGISIRGDSSSVTTIGRGALLTTDVDNTERQLVYTLRSLPDVTVGELRLDNRVLKVGDTFTQEDIGAGKVKYAYFRNGAGDGFEFSVSDGATGGTLSNAFFDITYNYS